MKRKAPPQQQADLIGPSTYVTSATQSGFLDQKISLKFEGGLEKCDDEHTFVVEVEEETR